METQLNNEPEKTDVSLVIPQPTKWYKHRGLIAIVVLATIACIVSYIVFTKNRKVENNEAEVVKSTAQKVTALKPTPLQPYNSTLSFCDFRQASIEQIDNQQIIGLLRISPELITATVPTKIEIQAEIGNGPSLIPDSVELLRFDDNEKVTGSYGKMTFDPNKKGINDEKIYTTSIVLSEPLPSSDSKIALNFVTIGVAAQYQGLNCKPLSDLLLPHSYISVLPSGPSAQDTILQMADLLEQGNFAEAQKLLPSDKFRHSFDGLKKGDKNILSFVKVLREAKFKEGDEQRQVFTLHFENGDHDISLWRYYNGTYNGWVFQDDFPHLSPHEHGGAVGGYMNNSAKNPEVFGNCDIDNVKCIANLAFEKKDPELCAKMGSGGYLDSYCYIELSPLLDDISLCKKVNEFYQPSCILAIAKKHQDTNICDQSTDKNSCYSSTYTYIGQQTGNVEYCKKADSYHSIGTDTYLCYDASAIKSNDIKICDNIKTPSVGWCYVDYAVAKKDCFLLPSSVTDEMKKECKSRIDHPELWTNSNKE